VLNSRLFLDVNFGSALRPYRGIRGAGIRACKSGITSPMRDPLALVERFTTYCPVMGSGQVPQDVLPWKVGCGIMLKRSA
jgi:hypothetical protein